MSQSRSSLLLIEQEIETVFPEQLLTPALVKGDYGSVREALDSEGWPTLGEIPWPHDVHIILNNGEHTGPYTNDFTSLENRILFPRASSSQ